MRTSRPLAYIYCGLLCLLPALLGDAARGEPISAGVLAGPTEAPTIDAQQDLEKAVAAFNRGDHQAALAELVAAQKATPDLAPAEVMMAKLHFGAGQPRAGIAMLEKAIESSPDDPEAYLALIERALGEGRLTEADLMIGPAEKRVDAFAGNAQRKKQLQMRAYQFGAMIDQARNRLDSAKSKFEKLVALDDQNAAAHAGLGRVLFAQKDQKGAFREFQRAADANETSPAAELMIVSLFGDDQASAQKWLEFALKNHPNDVQTKLTAANYWLRANQLDKAQPYARDAVKLEPEGFEPNFLAGLIARTSGDYPAAEKYLSKAHFLQPANLNVMSHLALTLVELPDDVSRKRAAQFAELLARQNLTHAELLAALGWINDRLERPREAQAAFSAAVNALQSQPNQVMSPEMAFFLANMSKQRGNDQEAIRILREALGTKAPFIYRKNAEQLLAELTRSSG